ncbi:peptidylprolyl isomerase [Bartonella sp. HY329]|uniref:peptidylprolyl isomerase n=1 Tax=unclassified Bartonella TaxID=2645622 RepID=UPI0021C9E593|nr:MULTISPECIES: peptidylprolyl isomerase [unclassified Bartonella]UXM93902.1 peptidylprolyl isomerase [Bartonella sp. HY329]UXN08223.1 peptidylprolyl isomerase [Bartonella sp. HY328]
MVRIKSRLFAYLMSAALSVSFVGSDLAGLHSAQAASTTVALVVNGNAITNLDIEQRKAFLKVQNRGGNLTQLAREELTDEMLKRVEMKRRNIEVSLQEVNAAYDNFAARNNMSPQQMGQMLTQAGLTPAHFKAYIMVQMGWGRLVSARYRAEGMVSEGEAVQRMLKNGGVKPTANEYLLQQVIFVIPANRRGAILNQRRQEANALRARVNGCDSTRELVKGKIDITIRNLGRVLEQQLPPEWEKTVKATSSGKATAVQETARGVEFLTICSIRKVNDDRVAQLVFSIQEGSNGEAKAAQLEKKYIAELRKAARIQTP